jgi:hypothetical protein
MNPNELTDEELEAELNRRASARVGRLEIEPALLGDDWQAIFKVDPLKSMEQLSCQATTKRQALEDLLALDDLKREQRR